MRKIAVILALIWGFASLPLAAYASVADAMDGETGQATFLSATITNSANAEQTSLQDDNTASGVSLSEGDVLTITPQESAHAVYIIWERYPAGGYTLQQDGLSHEQNTGFFQEYVPLDGGDSPLTLTLHGEGKPVEIGVLTAGTAPADVHTWQTPAERADILLLPTHGDDEHLFFGAVMPTYTNRGDITIQVAYMVNHSTEPYRQQELLNGLWEAGLRHYPIIPTFPDQYSDSLEHAKTIYDETEIIAYIEELYNRFTPQVVVAHDLNGEYGHGAHMLYAETAWTAAQQAAHTPHKVYLHLYEENPIVMDADTPLAAFSGRTAFEVATDAFGHHESQHIYFSVDETGGPYDLRKFGLAVSTVPADTGNDMMENIIPYAEQERLAEEAAAEEAALAQAAASAAESEPAEAASSPLPEEPLQISNVTLIGTILLTIAVLVLIVLLFTRHQRRKR